MTRTFVVLEVDQATFDDVKQRLLAAGYGGAISPDSDYSEVIDMQGIALGASPLQKRVADARAREEQRRSARRENIIEFCLWAGVAGGFLGMLTFVCALRWLH